MLTQKDAENLITAFKNLITDSDINFPVPGEYLILDAESIHNNDKFKIDINRKGTIKISKATYQARYKNNIKLLRIDIDGPVHCNPDGIKVPCPHIHIYTEDYDLKWAYPLENNIRTNQSDLIQVLIDFLLHINIKNIKGFNFSGGELI